MRRTKRQVATLFTSGCVVLLSACGVDRGGIVTTIAPTTLTTSIIAAGAVTKSASQFDVAGSAWDVDTASVFVDGVAATLAEIENGAYVVVAGVSGVTPTATRITLSRPVIGQVETTDIATESFTVLGQQVRVTPATVFASPWETDGLSALTSADEVVVSGPRLIDGSIVATRVAPNANMAGFAVTGPVAGLDASAGTFVVGGLNVIDLNLTLIDGFAGLVRLSGFTLNAGTIAGATVEVLSGSAVGIDALSAGTGSLSLASQIEVRIDAPVYDVPGTATTNLSIGGVTVVTDSSTQFIGTTSDDLAVNQQVRLVGTSADQGQSVLATSITLLSAPVIAKAETTVTRDSRRNRL